MPCIKASTNDRFPVRCRSCSFCLALEKWEWSSRTLAEISTVKTVWFVTLTFRRVPSSEPDAYRRCQTWLKRVRRLAPDLRYFGAPEWGEKNGRLHYHWIVCSDHKLRRRDLTSNWSEGITHAKRIKGGKTDDPKEGLRLARYVSKYGVKQGGRKRASINWGAEGVERVLRAHSAWFTEVAECFGATTITKVRVGPDGASVSVPYRWLRKGYTRASGFNPVGLPCAGLSNHPNPSERNEHERMMDELAAEWSASFARLKGRGLIPHDERVEECQSAYRKTLLLERLAEPFVT